MSLKSDSQSKLKLLRAVVALKKFTVAEIMSWTGLERSQIDPQISRLRNAGVIEYDDEAPQSGPRAPFRPIRHYRLALDPEKRSKAFSEIRSVRAAVGDDGSERQLALIQGELSALSELLDGWRRYRAALNQEEYREYRRQVERVGHALDEAVLELEIDDAAIASQIASLEGSHKQLLATVSEMDPCRQALSGPLHSGGWDVFSHVKKNYTLPHLQRMAASASFA